MQYEWDWINEVKSIIFIICKVLSVLIEKKECKVNIMSILKEEEENKVTFFSLLGLFLWKSVHFSLKIHTVYVNY